MRGSIVDVFPSTADAPVRIDLWGDEVDRLTEFSVSRPALHRRPRPRSRSSPAASCCPPTRCASGPTGSSAAEPWGREQWERLAEGQIFDGMESWLPWLTEGEQRAARPASPDDAQVLLVEPRRMRDRAADLLAEEADLAATLAQHVGRDGADGDELPPPAPAVRPAARPHRRRRRGPSPPRPRGPTSPPCTSIGVAPGGRRRRARCVTPARPSCSPTATGSSSAADGEGSAGPPAASCSREPRRSTPDDRGRRRSSGAASSPASSWRCSPSPTSPAGAAPTARPGPASATPPGFFDDLKAGDHVVHHQHGVGPLRRHGQAGHRRRRARLPAARVPGRRQALRPVRPDRRRAPLHRRRRADASAASAATDWQKAKAQVRSAVSEIAQELVVLYQTRLHTPGPRLRRTTRRGSASWRRPSPTRRRPTSSRPSTT